MTRLRKLATRIIANDRVFYALAIGGLTYAAFMFVVAVTA
jgi:hypothetical protein